MASPRNFTEWIKYTIPINWTKEKNKFKGRSLAWRIPLTIVSPIWVGPSALWLYAADKIRHQGYIGEVSKVEGDLKNFSMAEHIRGDEQSNVSSSIAPPKSRLTDETPPWESQPTCTSAETKPDTDELSDLDIDEQEHAEIEHIENDELDDLGSEHAGFGLQDIHDDHDYQPSDELDSSDLYTQDENNTSHNHDDSYDAHETAFSDADELDDLGASGDGHAHASPEGNDDAAGDHAAEQREDYPEHAHEDEGPHQVHGANYLDEDIGPEHG